MTILSDCTGHTRHDASSVFAQWADPRTWPAWDPEVASVSFEPPALLGKKGKLKPSSGPTLPFSITRIEPDRVFTNTGTLPGAKLDFEHVVSPAGEGSEVRVTVRLRGPLAPIWKRLVGPGMASAAQSSVQGLLDHLDRAAS